MFLSFIVPVYNTEEYLDECLQSMLQQDLPQDDYEIICINDGSTDGSLGILRRYEREYPNVVVIDQENGGVCNARNAGLKVAQGEYIWYIDADDFIEPRSLNLLKTRCSAEQYDRLIINNYQYFPGHSEPMPQNSSWKDSVVWRSLFRREFLVAHNLLFHYPELSFGEDALYIYEVKRNFPLTDERTEPVYYHRERPGSLSTDMSDQVEARRLQCTIREAEILKEYYEKKDGILPEETAKRFMSFLWGALFRILSLSAKDARPYLQELKRKGLYPYPRPKECTLKKCPQISRSDWLGKIIDFLYINLSTRWGYHGMRQLQRLFRLRQKISW